MLRSVSPTGVFGLLSRHSRESHRALKMIFDLGAILMQATGFIIWPLVESWQVGGLHFVVQFLYHLPLTE